MAEGDAGEAGPVRRADDRLSVEASPAFREWFGDSKVVDADGKPVWEHLGTQRKSLDTSKPATTKWKFINPSFQGGKESLADRVTGMIRSECTADELASFTHVVDHFGEGGSWGLFNTLESLPNASLLTVRELNPDRLLKIKLFHYGLVDAVREIRGVRVKR